MDLKKCTDALKELIGDLNVRHKKGEEGFIRTHMARAFLDILEELWTFIDNPHDRAVIAEELRLASQACERPAYAWMLRSSAKDLGADLGNPTD